MKIVKAEIGQADLVGRLHSEAWKQAYTDVFPKAYLNKDTPEKRTQEFLESCNNLDISYYVMYEDEKAIGMIKVRSTSGGCEISSLYILEECRNKGYGKQLLLWAMNHIRKDNDREITLHVAEWNKKALELYESVGFLVRRRQKVK